jgi:hypothetical protein
VDDQRDFMVAMIAQNQQLLDVLKAADAAAAAAPPKKTKKRRPQQGPSTRLLLLAVLASALTFGMLWCCLAIQF